MFIQPRSSVIFSVVVATALLLGAASCHSGNGGGGSTGQGSSSSTLSAEDVRNLRDEAKDMFDHAYHAYMDNAYPADELMPLSCQGRFRGVQGDRGDIDDALGNFSLTLIDTLDTLVVMGELEEFERGVKLVIDHVTFDTDVAVSVFETNIRVVGGLVSAHILADYLRNTKGQQVMSWYSGELLDMALDVGYRLLPAFNSSTGLPHPRVNLRHGIKAGKVKSVGETCTACAGTMILEMAALSRLTGEPVFEEKASRAMDVLWASRHRMSNLVGNVLNIQTGDWVRRDSGVGAGIDSYYEYVAKAYVLLGEEKYLDRWQTHYAAVMKYLGQGHLMQDVHMHKPQSPSKPFVDALGAFWPGLQVLMGDVKPAIENHEVLYQIMQRHHFIPEAFTTDFQVHWGQYLLRPEFVESTYFLHRATGDPHYLEVGSQILRGLQEHARVTCGYATIKDVRTLQKEDRMDSFVLSETFKYLYLLFAEASSSDGDGDDQTNIPIDINNFIFTTEGHLLPLSLARLSNRTAVPVPDKVKVKVDDDVEYARSCPSISYLFPEVESVSEYAASLRLPLANVVADKCPTKKVTRRRLLATEFQSNNPDHLALIKDMGITFMSLPDGRVQLLHTAANAKSVQDSEEGIIFMQEMIELSKQQQAAAAQTNEQQPPKAVAFEHQGRKVQVLAGPAQFGREIADGFEVSGELVVADPIRACESVTNGKDFWGKIVLVERGDCMFVEKARVLESHGAKGGIVLDNNPESTSEGTNLFAMSGDGTDDVSIPMVFLFFKDAKPLMNALETEPYTINVKLGEFKSTKKSKKSGKKSRSSSTLRDEEEEEEEESNSSFDITSPVSSFLQKSRRQVEKYFRGVLSSSTTDDEEEEEEMDGEEAPDDVIGTEEDSDDKIQVMTELEEENETASSVSQQQNEVKSRKDSATEEEEDSSIDFSNLETLLHPESQQIQRQIENRVIKNPRLLSELLSVKFTDLVAVFKDILAKNSGKNGDAYLRLFELLESRGADGVTDLASSLKDAKENVDSFDEVVDEVLAKYVEKVGSDQEEDEVVLQERRDKIRVAALLDLMNDQVVISDNSDEKTPSSSEKDEL